MTTVLIFVVLLASLAVAMTDSSKRNLRWPARRVDALCQHHCIPALSPDQQAHIDGLLRAGDKVHAVRDYCRITGADIGEAATTLGVARRRRGAVR